MSRRDEKRLLPRRRFLQLAAAAGLLASTRRAWPLAVSERVTVTGRVLADGAPLAGVCVSDGRIVTKTDASGEYSIDVGPESGRFLFVTPPRGYWTDLFWVPPSRAARDGRVDFRLHARTQSDRFRFAFWTDIHLEGGGIRIDKFRATVAETRELAPDFVWAQGDISLEGKMGAHYVECCAELDVPIRNGIGNHDLLVNADDPRSDYESLFGPGYYSFDWGGVHCVVLDGNRVVSNEVNWRSSHGFFSEREIAWLEADLSAKPPGAPVIVGVHVPLVSTYSDRRRGPPGGLPQWIVSNRERVCEILAAHDTRLVLQGHLHENERIWRNGIEFVESQAISGSWWRGGSGFERGVDGGPRGYRIVEVDGTKITHRFLSSAESRVAASGEFLHRHRCLRPRRKTHFVYNCWDAPNDARSRVRIDGGPWRPMMSHPEVHRRMGLIRPHHFLADVDTTTLATGDHTIEVQTTARGETFRHRDTFTLGERGSRGVPVIWAAVGSGVADDRDDLLDLALLLAIDELDVRAIVLDDGVGRSTYSGFDALEGLQSITGCEARVAVGSASRTSPTDGAARERPREPHSGVELIVNTLRESEVPVTIIDVGNLRDVAAAIEREPDLCAAKIDRLYAFVDEAAPPDTGAFVAVFRSGLPQYWVPRFRDDIRRIASHSQILANVREPVQLLFDRDRRGRTAIAAAAYAAAGRAQAPRTAVFAHAADRKLVADEGRCRSVPWDSAAGEAVPAPFTFERVLVDVDDAGRVRRSSVPPHYAVERFRVLEPVAYSAAISSVTADLLEQL